MIPTKKQINPYPGDLDGDYAVQNWLGKSIQDGVTMLESNSLHYCEDFTYMGKYAYNYYFDSIIEYAKSDKSNEDCDFINAVLNSTIEFRWDEEKDIIEGSKSKINHFLNLIITNYDKFEIDLDIYGDLKLKAQELIEKIKA